MDAGLFYHKFKGRFDRLIAENLSQVLIVGLSGGVDSVSLFDLCLRYRNDYCPEVEIVAAHVNHCLRGLDSDGDEEFSKSLCADAGVRFESRRIDVKKKSCELNIGVEEAGRIARREFFAELAGDSESAVILLGHHANDQAETVMMNLIRGCGLHGLTGMMGIDDDSRYGITIVRPLLEFFREDIESYARARGLKWQEDRTNEDVNYTRNMIRHELLPLIERMRPCFARRINLMSDVLRNIGAFLLARGNAEHDRFVISESYGLRFLYPDCESEKALLIEIICSSLAKAPYHKTFSASDFDCLGRMIDGSRGLLLPVSQEYFLRSESDGICLLPSSGDSMGIMKEKADDVIYLPGRGDFSVVKSGFRITGKIMSFSYGDDIPNTDRNDNCVEWLDAAKITHPLSVRSRRDGDRMRLLGSLGEKKVKDILVDLKVPQREKDGVRCICDMDGIVWLWPQRVCDRAKITRETTAVLRLEIRDA